MAEKKNKINAGETPKTVSALKEESKINLVNLYKVFSEPVPKEYLITYNEDGKEFTGYNAQYAIDLLNKHVGLSRWQTREKIEKQELLNKGWFVAMSMELWIDDEIDVICGKRVFVTGYGASFAKNGANAYKGAKTSAFKNACRFLGIGQELYKQGFDDDIREAKEEKVISTEAIVVETTETNQPIETNMVEILINKISEAQTKEEVEMLRDQVVSAEAGEAVKKLLFKKFNEKLISFDN